MSAKIALAGFRGPTQAVMAAVVSFAGSDRSCLPVLTAIWFLKLAPLFARSERSHEAGVMCANDATKVPAAMWGPVY